MYFCSEVGKIAPQRPRTMNIITHKECPLCQSKAIGKRFTCKDHFATGEMFDIFKCKECGFVFTQNIPDEKEIARYYDSPTYISHSDTKKGIVNRLYHLVRSIMMRRKVSLMKRLTLLRNGRIVDYGAGTGSFAYEMQRKGWNVTAIEKSEQARAFAKEKHGIELQPEEAIKKIESCSVDIVTMWHVLEHIQQADALWDEVHRILDETGIAVIACPNCSSYDAGNYQENWAAYDVPRHLWHFTPSTIMKMGEKHGFILERQYPMPFDGFYISMLSEGYKGSRLKMPRGVWNGFLGFCATMDKCSASSSIIYVFRKKR